MDASIAQMEAMVNGGTGTSLPVLASRGWRMRTRVGAGNEGDLNNTPVRLYGILKYIDPVSLLVVRTPI